MGLADRFKDKLDSKDIFKKNKIENSFNDKSIQFISKPITENIVIQPKVIHSGQIENIENISDIKNTDSAHWDLNNPVKFEELETEIIRKIRKTPYWEDFSTIKKENMISKYFDRKIQNEKYSMIAYNSKDKLNFIQNILALSNNR